MVIVAHAQEVCVRSAYAIPVRPYIVLDAVLLEERLDAVADSGVVILRRHASLQRLADASKKEEKE